MFDCLSGNIEQKFQKNRNMSDMFVFVYPTLPGTEGFNNYVVNNLVMIEIVGRSMHISRQWNIIQPQSR